MALKCGDINIWPSLHQLQLPCYSQAELSSLIGLRAWGEEQKSHHNITFLVGLTREEATGDSKYGLSTVWVSPSQARVPPDWPYTLVQLHEGTHHVPVPKEGHLGILPQRGAEANPCRQISQLEVCQLIITSPQVVYPIGLNGCNEPIITPLPEPLASGMSYHRQACLPGN